MRLSSVIPLLILYLIVNFFMGCSYFKKAPARQEYFYTEFREPTFIVTFSWVSDDEKPIIINYFKNRKEARLLSSDELGSNEDFGYEIRLDSKDSAAIVEFFRQILLWNRNIISIGKEEKAQILGGGKARVQLGYISTRAITRTSAKIIILPEPAGAKLYIDTKIPDIEFRKNPVDGSVILNVDDRLFETFLPFSFIMENPRIYFRTSLNNITRYFYYDLKLEKQIEIFGITSDNDYKYYQKNGKLPSRD